MEIQACGFKDKILKKLQETLDQNWEFTSVGQLSGVVKRPERPKQVILLLHGLNERGKRIMRKLVSALPDDALILAPNGPFPIPRLKDNRVTYGHSWYFFDKFEQKYFVNQDLAKHWLKEVVKQENPNKLPVTIIGFSQGGYLAPLVGEIIAETKLVIGLACEFRSNLIQTPLTFPLEAIHGKLDEIVLSDWATREITILRERGHQIGLHLLENTSHEISQEMCKTVKIIMEQYGN